jgi:basic membrane protein A
MKKFLALLTVFSFVLAGCGGVNDEGDIEVALITDEGDINDKSFNQSAWEAVEQFGNETGINYRYYQPVTFDTAGYTTQIQNAVDNGAKIIVCPGHKFQESLGQAQDQFPDVKFVMIDAVPTVNDEPVEIGNNVYSALYLEQQPGYLAGYAVVKDGHTRLGFMGGIALPAVINFGYGFVQGALDAAEEMGVKIDVKYKYMGTFSESPDIKAEAAAWYNDGTEVIFSCGGAICNSIFAAAEEVGALAIGVDSDQKDDSKSVITSALKGVNKAVYDALYAYHEDRFPSGLVVLDAGEDYIGLSDDFSRFTKFTKEDYDAIFAKVKAGNVQIKGHTDVNAAGDPTTFQNDTMSIQYFNSN